MHRIPARARIRAIVPSRPLSSLFKQPLLTVPLVGALAASALLPVSSCHRKASQAEAAKPKAAAPPRVSDADVARYRPNEAGAIMIVMYHDVDAARPNSDLNRKPAQFRADLDSLYALGYRPVTVSEMVENNMDVPAGKTPIVLTFDDSKPSQFRLIPGKDGKQHIDPNCAVGIMEVFHKKHPDWPTKATFFVLPKEGRNYDPFAQPESVQDKLAYLLGSGYEIANHTSTHPRLHHMAVGKVRWELATALRDIKQIAPKALVQVVALPYGEIPRDKQARAALIAGSDGGTTYRHKAVVLAAWRPVLSPVTKPERRLTDGGALAVYDPYHLERVVPDPRQAKKPGTLEYWLRYFQKNPGLRYRSDGNVKIVTVPASHKNDVDEARVKAQGKLVQFYGGAPANGAKGGGVGLSVE